MRTPSTPQSHLQDIDIWAGVPAFKGAGRMAGQLHNGGVMQLTEKQRRHLKGLAHPLKPVILIGNSGLTDAVVAETSRALNDHELIKVRLPGLNREERDAALKSLAERTSSEFVTRIGHIAVLFRQREKVSRFVLPA